MTAENFKAATTKPADNGVAHWLADTVLHPVINGSGIIQIYDTLAGKPAESLSQTQAKTGSLDWMVETLAQTTGAIIPYVLAGKFAGGFIGNETAAQIIGAGAYTALEAPGAGQTRFGNALGTMTMFGAFEGGNKLLGKIDGSVSNRLLAGSLKGVGRIGVGMAAGLASYETTSYASSLTGAKGAEPTWSGALDSMASGGLMNFALPSVQRGAGKVLGHTADFVRALRGNGPAPAESVPVSDTAPPARLEARKSGVLAPFDVNETGSDQPLGATVTDSGTNFAIKAPQATGIDLLLYSHPDDPQPHTVLPLFASGDTWHRFVPDAGDGTLYNYRVHGPYQPAVDGTRFNATKVVTDPRAKALTEDKRTSGALDLGYDNSNPNDPNRHLIPSTVDNSGDMPKSVAVKLGTYDWGGDQHPNTPMADSIFYEANLRGFTAAAPDVPAHLQGTYPGAAMKAGYVQDLGVTAVEWQPLQKFDHADQSGTNPITGKPLENAWGYNTMNFDAPDEKFSSDKTPGQQIKEFKDMVKAYHEKNIEVIMDVVYNHTAEGNQLGPTFSFKGIDNNRFYLLAPGHPEFYMDHTGVGNTVNASDPATTDFILNSLKYWVQEMHVDGFRFDLAAVFHFDTNGQLKDSTPILQAIEKDPVLSKVKLIAEPWGTDSYYGGHFWPNTWSEWSDKYRDTVRKFVRSDAGVAGGLADVIVGQPSSFDRSQGRYPVNYVVSHDGFTLNDLVSYNGKHNEANGENNRDGTDNNLSWNGGWEGPLDNAPLTDAQKAEIQGLRARQAKNFMTLLHVSQGPPMMLFGDEVLRTTGGNNNPYNQIDLNNLDWSLLQKNGWMHDFTKQVIDFRKENHIGQLGPSDLTWHGVEPNAPDFSDGSRTIAWEYKPATADGKRLYFAMNSYWNPIKFDLPEGSWHRRIDTNLAGGQDIVASKDAPVVSGGSYWVGPRSIIVLEADPNATAAGKHP